MSADDSFKIISVTGAHSSVGKTTLCGILLNILKGFGAVKFTKTPLYTSVIDDPEVILQEDKDTALMSRSGAEKVVWIKSDGAGLENALDVALGKMTGLSGVVVEGNSPADFLSADLIIFVMDRSRDIKQSALKACRMADIIIFNSEEQAGNPSFPAKMFKKTAKTFRINLISRQGEIDKFLSYVKEYIK